MRIGDRVRLLRGTEEGNIVNIKGDKIVEIEIEDGFVIPVLKNEVVLIDKSEAGQFPVEEKEMETFQQNRSDENISRGLYIGLTQKQENQYRAYFINQQSDIVLFSICQYGKKTISGKAYGVCRAFEFVEIGELTSSIFNSNKKLNIQIINYEDQARLKKSPLNIDLYLEKTNLPEKVFFESLEKEIFLIKIEERQMSEIDPEELKEKLFESNYRSYSNKETKTFHKEKTIDLHVDDLTIDLKKNEILEYQLNEFEKAYDEALLVNLEKLKVIHGVGAGILRGEIHRRLGAKKEVKFFEDADKERFGFGSTIIYF